MAFMALAGASSATATETTLCKQKETVSGLPQCIAANQYPKETVVHAELEAGSFFLLETVAGNVECEESTIEVTTEQQTHIPLGANVNAFNFGKCNNVIRTAKNGTLDIEIIDLPEWTHNGTLTFTETEVTVEIAGLHCIYKPGDTGTLTGGEMATIDLIATWARTGGRSGIFCGNGANAAAHYTVKKPEPLWVSM